MTFAVLVERLSITLTSNVKREFVPGDQVPLCLSSTVHYFFISLAKSLSTRIFSAVFICSFFILRNSQLESDVCCLPYTWSLNSLFTKKVDVVKLKISFDLKQIWHSVKELTLTASGASSLSSNRPCTVHSTGWDLYAASTQSSNSNEYTTVSPWVQRWLVAEPFWRDSRLFKLLVLTLLPVDKKCNWNRMNS